MKCKRFRGLDVSFGFCSPLVSVAVHWTGGRTIICPRAAQVGCSVCRGMMPRLLGYAAVKERLPSGSWSEIFLAELPPSLVLLTAGFVDPQTDPLSIDGGVPGLLVRCTRASVRSAWEGIECERLPVSTSIDLGEVLDSVARLYRLPSAAGAARASFVDRFSGALRVRHDEAAAVDVLA
jgi:hypothetical protein